MIDLITPCRECGTAIPMTEAISAQLRRDAEDPPRGDHQPRISRRVEQAQRFHQGQTRGCNKRSGSTKAKPVGRNQRSGSAKVKPVGWNKRSGSTTVKPVRWNKRSGSAKSNP